VSLASLATQTPRHTSHLLDMPSGILPITPWQDASTHWLETELC